MRIALSLVAATAALGGFFAVVSCGTAKPGCTPTSCSGCCDATGSCQLGTTGQACGVGGASCLTCSGSQLCSLGFCNPVGSGGGGGGAGGGSGGGGGTNGAGLDAGIVPTGGECVGGGDCAGNDAGYLPNCMSGWPAGYCSNACNTKADCPGPGVVCFNGKACTTGCPAPDGGRSTCRAGYLCAIEPYQGGPAGGCIPDCRVVVSICSGSVTCQSDGYCR